MSIWGWGYRWVVRSLPRFLSQQQSHDPAFNKCYISFRCCETLLVVVYLFKPQPFYNLELFFNINFDKNSCWLYIFFSHNNCIIWSCFSISILIKPYCTKQHLSFPIGLFQIKYNPFGDRVPSDDFILETNYLFRTNSSVWENMDHPKGGLNVI